MIRRYVCLGGGTLRDVTRMGHRGHTRRCSLVLEVGLQDKLHNVFTVMGCTENKVEKMCLFTQKASQDTFNLNLKVSQQLSPAVLRCQRDARYLSPCRWGAPGSPGRGGWLLLWRGKVLCLGARGEEKNFKSHCVRKRHVGVSSLNEKERSGIRKSPSSRACWRNRRGEKGSRCHSGQIHPGNKIFNLPLSSHRTCESKAYINIYQTAGGGVGYSWKLNHLIWGEGAVCRPVGRRSGWRVAPVDGGGGRRENGRFGPDGKIGDICLRPEWTNTKD